MVAMSTERLSEPEPVPTVREAAAAPLVAVRAPSDAPTGQLVATRPVAAVAPGRIQDRMAALGFSTTVAADAQRVIDLVRAEADAESGTAMELRIDKVFEEGAVTGSLHHAGVRIATFVLWLDPAPTGGTRAVFRVEWYITARPTTLGIPVGPKDSIAFWPLRVFATRLAGRLREEHA